MWAGRTLTDRKRVLAKVTKALGALSGWAKLDFFESPNALLEGLSPLEALAKGRVAEVLALAKTYGEDEAQNARRT